MKEQKFNDLHMSQSIYLYLFRKTKELRHCIILFSFENIYRENK